MSPGAGGHGNGPDHTPPRIAELLFRLLTPDRYRDEILGDLREEFAARLTRAGRFAALRWYLRQLLKSAGPGLALRLRSLRSPGRHRSNRGEVINGRLRQDLRFVLRSVKNRPVFYAVILSIFALGIGVNSIIFSVVDGVVLRPLPYPEPDRLVVLWRTSGIWAASPNPAMQAIGRRSVIPYPVFQDWQEQNTVLDVLGVQQKASFYGDLGDGLTRIQGLRVTHGVFAALGVPPILGRTFLPKDDEIEEPRLAVLSYGFWLRAFGADSTLVGRTLDLNGEPYSIIGVMPRGFDYLEAPDIWTTFSHADDPGLYRRGVHLLRTVARLAPGVTLARAQREMEVLEARLNEANGVAEEEFGVRIELLQDAVVGGVRPAFLLLLAASGVLLLIVCINIANLLMVRASERRNEMAVRVSLGAGRGRILQQLVTEGLTLSVMGGGLGCLVALAFLHPFIALLPPETPRLSHIVIDHRVLAFSAILTILTGTGVAVFPAFGALRSRLTTVLQETGRSTSGSVGRNRAQAGLLVSQIALAFVLLVGAGVLARSFLRLTSVEPGFDAERVINLEIDWRGFTYVSESQPRTAFEDLLDRLQAIPGVTDIAVTRTGPFLLTVTRDIMIETREGAIYTLPHYDMVSGSYFRTMGIPLLEGRTFYPDERDLVDPVVMVNEALARAFWPNEAAVGKRIKLGDTVDSDRPWLTVIGVVGDVRTRLDEDPYYMVYFPPSARNPQLVLKSAVSPPSVFGAIRSAVREADPSMSVAKLEALGETVHASVAAPRVRTTLMGALALLAAILATVGIFGVLAYSVAQHTKEIGIRMAMGATPNDVMGSVLMRGLRYLGSGMAIGLGASLLSVGALKRFLFEIDPVDPATLVFVTLLLTATTLVASFLPARRAAILDPVRALRRE